MIISRTVTVHIHVTFITYFFQITGVPLVIPSTSSNVISPTSTTTTSITSSMTTSSSKPSAGKLFLNHVMILSLFFCHYSILVHTCAMYTRMITPKISYTHTYTPYNIHVSTFSSTRTWTWSYYWYSNWNFITSNCDYNCISNSYLLCYKRSENF